MQSKNKPNIIMYKIKFWNDSIKDFQTLEQPYLESALMTANKLANQYKIGVFITDGTINNTFICSYK